MSPPTRATKTSALKSRPITIPTTVAIRLPNTNRAMTGTATHFTHHGRPAKISRIALVLCSRSPALDARAATGPPGFARPLSSPDSSPRESPGGASGLRGREDHQDPEVLADVVELVGDAGRHVHHAAACHLGGLQADRDRGMAA